MKLSIILKRGTLALLMIIFAMGSFGHTSIKSTFPEATSMIHEPPENLTLEFSGKVRLMQVKLESKKSGKTTKLNFRPSKSAKKKFDLPFPQLSSDTYFVHWTTLGTDGHKMKGKFDFTLMQEKLEH